MVLSTKPRSWGMISLTATVVSQLPSSEKQQVAKPVATIKDEQEQVSANALTDTVKAQEEVKKEENAGQQENVMPQWKKLLQNQKFKQVLKV